MKKRGWFKESYRHKLAARGVKTNYYAPKTAFGKSIAGITRAAQGRTQRQEEQRRRVPVVLTREQQEKQAQALSGVLAQQREEAKIQLGLAQEAAQQRAQVSQLTPEEKMRIDERLQTVLGRDILSQLNDEEKAFVYVVSNTVPGQKKKASPRTTYKKVIAGYTDKKRKLEKQAKTATGQKRVEIDARLKELEKKMKLAETVDSVVDEIPGKYNAITNELDAANLILRIKQKTGDDIQVFLKDYRRESGVNL